MTRQKAERYFKTRLKIQENDEDLRLNVYNLAEIGKKNTAWK